MQFSKKNCPVRSCCCCNWEMQGCSIFNVNRSFTSIVSIGEHYNNMHCICMHESNIHSDNPVIDAERFVRRQRPAAHMAQTVEVESKYTPRLCLHLYISMLFYLIFPPRNHGPSSHTYAYSVGLILRMCMFVCMVFCEWVCVCVCMEWYDVSGFRGPLYWWLFDACSAWA